MRHDGVGLNRNLFVKSDQCVESKENVEGNESNVAMDWEWPSKSKQICAYNGWQGTGKRPAWTA